MGKKKDRKLKREGLREQKRGNRIKIIGIVVGGLISILIAVLGWVCFSGDSVTNIINIYSDVPIELSGDTWFEIPKEHDSCQYARG